MFKHVARFTIGVLVLYAITLIGFIAAVLYEMVPVPSVYLCLGFLVVTSLSYVVGWAVEKRYKQEF